MISNGRETLIRYIGLAGPALGIVFALTVILQSLPLQLLNRLWQLRFGAIVINQTPLAIAAFFLIHLAAILDIKNGPFAKLRNIWRHWATLAVIGYLLLVPLCATATSHTLRSAVATQRLQLNQAEQRMRNLQEAIDRSTSIEDLQVRFASQQGPSLTPADKRLPLARLRSRLSLSLREAHSSVVKTETKRAEQQRFPILLESIRLCLVSVIYAIVFASAAQGLKSEMTLFERLWRLGAPKIAKPPHFDFN